MKQPDLGKKIVELRLAKGLTQGELAEKCKLSLRTIQRIESAEVLPRSYTVKLIFANLDYEIYNSFGRFSYRLDRSMYRLKIWLGQFYTYVSEVFNLKTNTMKKIMILSVPFITFCIIIAFTITSGVKAQSKRAVLEEFERVSAQSDFILWFNAGQFDSLSLQYHDHACFMPDQYPTLTDRQSIKAYYSHLYDHGIRFIELKTTSKVISDLIVVERGIWKVSVNSGLIVSGTFLSQWHYIDGKWGIENEMSKSDAMVNPGL